MRPPLKSVPMDRKPLSVGEMLSEAAQWAEYSAELLGDDPDAPQIVAVDLPRLNRVLERLRAYQNLTDVK